MANYKFHLGIGIANAYQEEIIDVDDEELAECDTEAERENLLEQYWQDWANNYIDGGYWKED